MYIIYLQILYMYTWLSSEAVLDTGVNIYIIYKYTCVSIHTCENTNGHTDKLTCAYTKIFYARIRYICIHLTVKWSCAGHKYTCKQNTYVYLHIYIHTRAHTRTYRHADKQIYQNMFTSYMYTLYMYTCLAVKCSSA